MVFIFCSPFCESYYRLVPSAFTEGTLLTIIFLCERKRESMSEFPWFRIELPFLIYSLDYSEFSWQLLSETLMFHSKSALDFMGLFFPRESFLTVFSIDSIFELSMEFFLY
jgi:hypothetical protein